jgi:hypothetical protein
MKNVEFNKEKFELKFDGISLKIDIPVILDNFFSEVSKKLLNDWISVELNSMLPQFTELYNSYNGSEDKEKFMSVLHTERNELVYKYITLCRDFHYVCGDTFEYFYTDNMYVMGFIRLVYNFNPTYGFVPYEKIDLCNNKIN